MKAVRIGVMIGTFNPVHAGQISFALAAQNETFLDEIAFIPERQSYCGTPMEHYGHRVAMLRQAVRPYEQLALLELPDRTITAERLLMRLRQVYGAAEFSLLVGIEEFVRMPQWVSVDLIARSMEIVVAVRTNEQYKAALTTCHILGLNLNATTFIDSPRPDSAASGIRYAIQMGRREPGLLPSVQQYVRDSWLYATI